MQRQLHTKTKISLLVALIGLISLLPAQSKRFQGQGPTPIVSTVSKPIQKQWKGDYGFMEDSVIFSNDFEGGRLNGVVQSNDSTYTVLITSENTPINISPWYAFTVESKKEREIDVVLTYQETAKHRYYPKISYDRNNWKPLDSINYTEYDKGTDDFGAGSLAVSVKLRLKVGPQKLWVAGQELQTSQDVNEWITEISKNDYVNHQTIGTSREGRPLEALTIGKAKTKRMVMVISRQHPPEVTGYLAMQPFVETIAGNSQTAKKFRKKFTTYVVPLMNPDGVDNGHWRHNNGGIDLNRDWEAFEQPETTAVREFMKERVAATDGKFYFAIDFHSTWDDIYYTLADKFKGNMPGLVPKWLEALKSELPGYDPNIRPSEKTIPTMVSRNYFYEAHGAEALVFEIGDNTDREFIKKKGEVSALKLMELMLELK
ncbi:M14 family metallopeptidase [Muricauda sp. 2012CJ35-5]|uniref:M14 family metallopeptidase n=1 Tax=Flagellimonas spongiicola TaxID=2942208 RepID=A0ABT0PSG2_9FLAO|nr:M14-type cytosolic carboxypeptidase [Allomuricauda spongiicola]MCL6273388.1 M14 family metallopeptidase [Allomuricauda spongiicola]